MNHPLTDTEAVEGRIESKLDAGIAGSTAVSTSVGGLAFKDMAQVMEFAKLMSVSRQAVPRHLRGQPGMCLAISLQALNWRMDPFAVANKSYAVNDRVVYEAQLIQAVIEQRAPIRGRIKGELLGEGPDRQWRLWCIDEEGDRIEYVSPKISSITTKNSPLWMSDPDQQLWYYSARAMCRRHFPDVLLGVYEKEEISGMKDVTPPDDTPRRTLAQAIQEPEPTETPEEGPEGLYDAPVAPEYDENDVDPFSDAYAAGQKAFSKSDEGASVGDSNPYTENPDYSSFIGGWVFEQEQAAGK